MKKTIKQRIIFVIKSLLILVIIFAGYNIGERALFKMRISGHNQVVNRDEDSSLDATIESTNSYENIVSTENIEFLNAKYDEFIKVEGSVDDNIVIYLKKKLNLIPDNILSSYFDKGGTILLTSKNISETYYSKYDFGEIVGLHDANKNVVYMSNSEYAIDYALVHEFGHVLDSLTGWDSMKADFKNIFNKEKDTLDVYSIDEHYKSNEREFFAEVFQEYIINPDSCESSAPEAFQFIKNKINEI